LVLRIKEQEVNGKKKGREEKGKEKEKF